MDGSESVRCPACHPPAAEIIHAPVLMKPRQTATNSSGAFCVCICQPPPVQYLKTGRGHLPRLIWSDNWGGERVWALQPGANAAPHGHRLLSHMAAAWGTGNAYCPSESQWVENCWGRDHRSSWLKAAVDYFRTTEITTHLASLKHIRQWVKMCDRHRNRKRNYISFFFCLPFGNQGKKSSLHMNTSSLSTN